jgi:eukaryotic-like serine/threonine-protein kinase
VIHRDIKPGNVLVTLQGIGVMPKIIDFGIAKAIHHPLTRRPFQTQHCAILGTFNYMAPEQAELSVLDVDTRADIYALGCLLFEILTGNTPIPREEFAQISVPDAIRKIKETVLPRPSTRLVVGSSTVAELHMRC